MEILPKLFGHVIVPPRIQFELERDETPEPVRSWIAKKPSWLEVRAPSRVDEAIQLGAGEREAILLAEELRAAQIFLDDKKARTIALARGLRVTGTLAIPAEAGERSLLDFTQILRRLEATNFHASRKAMQEIIHRYRERKT